MLPLSDYCIGTSDIFFVPPDRLSYLHMKEDMEVHRRKMLGSFSPESYFMGLLDLYEQAVLEWQACSTTMDFDEWLEDMLPSKAVIAKCPSYKGFNWRMFRAAANWYNRDGRKVELMKIMFRIMENNMKGKKGRKRKLVEDTPPVMKKQRAKSPLHDAPPIEGDDE